MKKYLEPTYMNEMVMSEDVITVSHFSSNKVTFTDPETQEEKVLYVENVYRDQTSNSFSVEIGADVSTLLGL